MRRWVIAALAAVAGAQPARADLLPPGGGRPQQREVTVTGTVATLAGTQITLNDARGGQPQTFQLPGARRADELGLRVGDTATVTLRGFGNPLAAPVAAIDRVLPVSDLRLRVFAVGAATEPASLGGGPGCWVAGSTEICFISAANAVAMRYGTDGRLACSARLAPARDRGRWAAAAPPSCSAGATWALSSVRCDPAAQSCTLAGAGEERVAMTRR